MNFLDQGFRKLQLHTITVIFVISVLWVNPTGMTAAAGSVNGKDT